MRAPIIAYGLMVWIGMRTQYTIIHVESTLRQQIEKCAFRISIEQDTIWFTKFTSCFTLLNTCTHYNFDVTKLKEKNSGKGDSIHNQTIQRNVSILFSVLLCICLFFNLHNPNQAFDSSQISRYGKK